MPVPLKTVPSDLNKSKDSRSETSSHDMSNRPSALSLLAPFLLILIAAGVYYAKYHWARAWVDERYPWVKENIGSRLPSLVIAVDGNGQPIDESAKNAGAVDASAGSSTDSASDVPSRNPNSTPYVSLDGFVDVPRLAADPSSWPKTVKLKKPREFPAVVNGKAAGKIVAPPGSEAHLVSIQAGKLGLEFHGGGAWVPAEETDIAMRLRQ
jgi:hypothetical protein